MSTKFQRLLRNQFDGEILRAAAALDEAFQAALLKLIEWEGPILPSQRMQIQMAIQDGGCGFRSLAEVASEAAAAHVAEKAMLTAQLASVSSELVLETERAKRLEEEIERGEEVLIEIARSHRKSIGSGSPRGGGRGRAAGAAGHARDRAPGERRRVPQGFWTKTRRAHNLDTA